MMRRDLLAPVASLILSGAAALFCLIQAFAIANTCERNFTSIGLEGSNLQREVHGAALTCRYSDLAGGDFDFHIDALPLAIALALTILVTLISAAQIVSYLRKRAN